jgi:hypothetical protein
MKIIEQFWKQAKINSLRMFKILECIFSYTSSQGKWGVPNYGFWYYMNFIHIHDFYKLVEILWNQISQYS